MMVKKNVPVFLLSFFLVTSCSMAFAANIPVYDTAAVNLHLPNCKSFTTLGPLAAREINSYFQGNDFTGVYVQAFKDIQNQARALGANLITSYHEQDNALYVADDEVVYSTANVRAVAIKCSTSTTANAVARKK